MSKAFSNLIKKGKKKGSSKEKDTAHITPSNSAQKTVAPRPQPPKSLDDQTYNKWVQDHQNEEENADEPLEEEGQEAVVLFTYKPTGVEDEIALVKDEIILVIEQHPSGWWTGQSKAGYGLFPGSFVRLLSSDANQTAANPGSAPSLPASPAGDKSEKTPSSPQGPSSAPTPSASQATLESPRPQTISSSKSTGEIGPSPASQAEPSLPKSVSIEPLSEAAQRASAPTVTAPTPASAPVLSESEEASTSAFLKTVVDQLYLRISELQAKVAELERADASTGDASSLKAENEALKKSLEDMRVEKELSDWNYEKKISELSKQLARSPEGTIDNDVSQLQQQLTAEKEARLRENREHTEQLKQLQDTIASLRTTAASVSPSPASSSTPAPPSVPVDMMDQIKVFLAQQQSMLQAQMQAELQQIKSNVAKEAQLEQNLESQLADLKKQLEAEQKERAQLRQELISQMSTSQINRIKTEVLERSEVREGKLWDPINNVFLAADGKWLRPTGVDLTN